MSAGPKRLGKYELQERLGQGGMAEVWKAYDPQLKRYVAIKFLHAKLGSDPDFMTRFVREGQAIASLRHPNIVQVYDFHMSAPGADGPLAYMIMDYIVGQTLADYIHSTSARRNFLSASELVRLFTSISLAVDYAHRHGIIHRDIKPANILLDSRNTLYNPMGEPILTDFGIVKMLGASTLTSAGMSLGTPLYISPEQIQGLQPTEQSDIYSLGIMLYEMYVGLPPFRGDSPYTIMMQHLQAPPPQPSLVRQGIPTALDDVFARCLAKNPQERFPSASSLTAALAEALDVPVPEPISRSVSLLNSSQGRAFDGSSPDRTFLANANTPSVDSSSGLSTIRAEASAPSLASSPELPTILTDVNTPTGTRYSTSARSTPITPPPSVAAPADPAVASLPASTPPRPANRQRKRLIAIIAAVLLVLIIGSGLSVFLLSRSTGSTLGSANIVGHATFFSSRQLDNHGQPGYNDGIQVQLQNVANPPSGNSYYAWLQNDQTEAQSIYLGTLSVNHGVATLTYTDNQHRNLLGMMSNFLVTEESASVVPNTPSIDKNQWRYFATLPQTRSPKDNFSYLDHVRHLLSSDPALELLQLHRGINFWFLNNTEELQKQTVEVRDHGNLHKVRQYLANILYYLDGRCAPQDLINAPGSKVPENDTIAHDTKVGLLDCPLAPQPPGYITHIGNHLSGIAQAPGAPADQVQRAIQINKNLSNIKAWLQKVRADALQLAVMDDAHLSHAQALRNDMAVQAENIVSGGIDPATQSSVPSAAQLSSTIELLANFDVMPFKA
ncbi:MAG: serine/threonine protein kinase [Ktedonobacteraceae bacterium]